MQPANEATEPVEIFLNGEHVDTVKGVKVIVGGEHVANVTGSFSVSSPATRYDPDASVKAKIKAAYAYARDGGMRPIKAKKKPAGRNDLCPCKSGLKFKKCCGVRK